MGIMWVAYIVFPHTADVAPTCAKSVLSNIWPMCGRCWNPICVSHMGREIPHEQKLVGRILETYMLPTLEHMLAGCGPHMSLFAGNLI